MVVKETEAEASETSVDEVASAPKKRASRTTKAKSAEETEGETPKRTRRTTKKAASDDVSSDETSIEAASTEAESAEVSDEVAKTPRRRTRTTKAAKEEASSEDADKGAHDDESAAEHDASKEAASESTDANEGAADAKAAHTHVKQRLKTDAAHKNSNQSNQNGRNNRNQNGRRQRRQRDNRQQREYNPSITKEELEALKLPELREKAAELSIDASGMKKAEMVEAIYEAVLIAEGFIEVCGILDILQDGYGFLRTNGYLPSERDVYVGLSTIRRNGLRKGDLVVGQTRPAREGEKFAAIQKVFTVNGTPIEEVASRPKFSDLTPIFPDERLVMEHGKDTLTARVIDLAAPIGKGQRGLIVSPPKAGKTTVLKDIAASIHANNPEAHLICLLVDERPEEVTDMQRSVHGEVIASTFDMPSENHIAVAELVIERAKRLVEQGEDVVILLDSITRLARAYNLAQPASGRILSGGVDSTALYPPKRFLGAARNIENGGSLTILASALIDTGSKMDEVIFEEFKGTGNMELKLDRNLADRRIFPAIDPVSSGTRKEELLLDGQEAPLIWAVRRILANMNNTERSMDMLIKSLKQTDTNQDFLLRTAKRAQTQGRSDEGMVL